MGKLKYVTNLDPLDRTQRIKLGDGRSDLVLGGPAQEVSDEEAARLSSRVALEAEATERQDRRRQPQKAGKEE